MRQRDQHWWDTRKGRYPFHAIAPVSIKPTIVPGDHISCLFRTGWRIWGFKTLKERDTFVIQFGGIEHNEA